MAKTFVFGTSAALIVSIVVLAFSSYGIGREEKDTESPTYKVAQVFAGIAGVATFITMISLIVAVLQSPALREAGQIRFDPKAL